MVKFIVIFVIFAVSLILLVLLIWGINKLTTPIHHLKKVGPTWLITNQWVAYLIWLTVSSLLFLVCFKFFILAGGDKLPDIMYLAISLFILFGIFIGLYSSWSISITPQYRAELLYRNQRTHVWLDEGRWVVPFKGEHFMHLNEAEVQHTSKTDFIIPDFICHDMNGEEVLLKNINGDIRITDPSAYEEYDEATMKGNMIQLGQTSLSRLMKKINYWTGDVERRLDPSLDDYYIRMIEKYGFIFDNLVFVAQIADMSRDNVNAKWNRMVKQALDDFQTRYGRRPEKDEIKEIHARYDAMFALTKQVKVTNAGGGLNVTNTIT